MRDSRCLARVLRPLVDGGMRLETDGRSLGDLLALLDDPEVAELGVTTLVVDKTLSPRTVADLADNPGLARIRSLGLIDLKLGEQAFASLLQSPHAKGLRSLSLMSTDVGKSSLVEIERAGLSLDTLAIVRGSLDEEAIVAFVRSPAAGALKRLYLGRPLSTEALRGIVTSPSLRSLRSLCLADAKLSSADCALFGDAAFVELEQLELQRNPITSSALRAFGKATFSRSLRRLELSGTKVGDGAFDLLAKAGLDLHSLSLRQAGVTGKATEGLAGFTQLQELNVWGIRAGTEQGDSLAAQVARLTSLRSLELLALAITDSGAEAIAASALPGLRRLVLSSNQVSPRGAGALGRAAWIPALETLELRGYPGDAKIREQGARALAETGLPALRSLDLRNQAIGDAGLRAIAGAAPNLEQADVSECGLTAEGFGCLASAPFARTLRSLDAAFSPVASAAASVLSAMPALRTLRISGSTDADVMAMAGAAPPTLESLQLGGIGLSNVAIDALLPLTNRMVELVANFPNATPDKLKELATAMKPPRGTKPMTRAKSKVQRGLRPL